MRAKLIFRWYDLWIGIYIDRRNKYIYIFPIPMIGIRIFYGEIIKDTPDAPWNLKK